MKYPISDPGAYLHEGKFHDGDPTQGIRSSIAKAQQMNALYDELLYLIVNSGLTPSESNLTQVKAAIDVLISRGIATRAPLDHGHAWSQITGTPATYPPNSHTHSWSEVSGRPGDFCFSALTAQRPGTLPCNGAAVSRTTYAALFAAIGTSWGGGNGTTTFNVPDMRGEFFRGWDAGRGVDPGRPFPSFQNQQLLSHTHGTGASGAASGSKSGAALAHYSWGDYKTNGVDFTGGSENRVRNLTVYVSIFF